MDTDNKTNKKDSFVTNKLNYEVLERYWVTNDGQNIREWTPNEYLTCDPKEKITLTVGNVNKINIEAHCVEHRVGYATNRGVKYI